MSFLKRNLVPVLFAFGGVVMLVLAVLKAILTEKPFSYPLLAIACVFLTLAFATGRKAAGGTGPPPG